MAFTDELQALQSSLEAAGVSEPEFLAAASIHRITWWRWLAGKNSPRWSAWEDAKATAARLIADREGRPRSPEHQSDHAA